MTPVRKYENHSATYDRRDGIIRDDSWYEFTDAGFYRQVEHRTCKRWTAYTIHCGSYRTYVDQVDEARAAIRAAGYEIGEDWTEANRTSIGAALTGKQTRPKLSYWIIKDEL
jgi:hypothetical protein